MKYGLLGEKLTHSFSKSIHEMLSEYEYEIKEVSESELDEFLREKSFSGVNVTIPYKQTVIPYLDEISESAKKIGAVNTIINRNGKLCGYNTDYLGLKALVEKNKIDVSGKTVLILGTGGTAKTATQVFEDLGAEKIVKVSRKAKANAVDYETAYSEYNGSQIIVNTTPAGMYPNTEGIGVDVSKFNSLKAVLDVVYNPLRTNLVIEAQSRGIIADAGLYMLVAQAVYASELFLNIKYENGLIDKVFNAVISSKENIVLSGMPGSGKTTVGKILADLMKKKFADTDEIITKEENMEITDIFAKKGEQYFRNKESEVIKRYSQKADNLILSIGGGAVLRDENVRALKRNSKIYFLNRPLEEIIPTADRPLAKSKEDLQKRFRERYPRYVESADAEIKVDGTPCEVAEKIRKDYCHENKD